MGLCLAKDNLKCAASAVARFSLQPEFPAVEQRYRERCVDRMAARQRWGAAVVFAEGDRELQVLAALAHPSARGRLCRACGNSRIAAGGKASMV